MDLLAVEKIYDETKDYLRKSKELINVNRDEAKKYLELAEKCQRKADKLLGIIND